MDDIVTRLHQHHTGVCIACDAWGKCGSGERCTCICHRTERLHEEAAAEIKRLRAENNYLANCLERMHTSIGETLKAHDAWEEARHGWHVNARRH